MRIVSRTRLSGTAIVAAGTLLLAGALPALAQTATGSPSSSTAGQSTGSTTTGSTAGQSSPQMGAQKGKAPQSGMLSQSQLRRHARARVMIEQKAPDVHAKLAQVKDVNKELSSQERQQLQQALQGSGYTISSYAREHRQIMGSQRLQSRLQQMEQQVKSQSGAQQGQSGAGAATPGGSQSQTPATSASPSTGETSPSSAASPSTGSTSGGASTSSSPSQSSSPAGQSSGSQSTQPSTTSSPQ